MLLASGRTRQYSVVSDPTDRDLRIAVLRDPEGRGGSEEIHRLSPGDRVGLRGPRNRFTTAPASEHLLVAGGIGIAPLLPMIRALDAGGGRWTLLYRGRRRTTMAYADELHARYGQRVRLSASDTDPRPDLTAAVARLATRAQVIACGPPGLLDAVASAVRSRDDVTLAVERSVAPERHDGPPVPFRLELARSGRTVPVGSDETTLQALRRAGAGPVASCETGLCGTCETRVLAGRPEHRDHILADRERSDLFYPCVSRSLDDLLVVDA